MKRHIASGVLFVLAHLAYAANAPVIISAAHLAAGQIVISGRYLLLPRP